MSRFSKEIYLEIAQRIKSRRKSLGIRQSDIAQSLRLDRTAITRIENGNRYLEDAVDLFLIAEKLQVPIVSLFSEDTKLLVEKIPKYPDIFNLLPENVRINAYLSLEAIGSISSSQLYALLEIFKNNPWGKIRPVVASILPLLRDTWAASKITDEMECILLPEQGQDIFRFHTRLLAAEVLSAFVLSSDGLLSARGKKIQKKIEKCIENVSNSSSFEFLFLLEALSNLGVRNASAIKMEETYPLIRNRISHGVRIYDLIFAYKWGKFYRKDGVSSRPALENCLNLIITRRTSSAHDFYLKVWAQSLKTVYFSYREDWLESVFNDSAYQNLSGDEKASLIIVSLCASIHEFNYVQSQKPNQDQAIAYQKDQVHSLYHALITISGEIQSSLVRMWVLQTLLFLREQEIRQAPYTVGLSIETWLERFIEEITDVFQSSSNPIEKALALDFLLSSRIEKNIDQAMRDVYEFLELNSSHNNKLLYSLLIDIFCRTDLQNLLGSDFQQKDFEFTEFCQDPFAYMCHRFDFSNLDSEDGEFSSVAESWVCSAILRRETSASAHKYFLPEFDTTPAKSFSYNYKIGDAIGGNGIRYNLPNQYKNNTQDNNWWIWRIKDNDGDIYTLYSCQIKELIISRFVNEYFPMDSGFILFKGSNFLEGFYLYNSSETPFWGGYWTIEDT